MVEETKEGKTSQEKSSEDKRPPEEEKKQAPPVGAPARPAVSPPPGPTPPRPAQAPPVPRPAPVPPRAPPSIPTQPPKSSGRRGFIKAIIAVSAVLSIVPFVPWGNYLLGSVSGTGTLARQKAQLDENTKNNNNYNGVAAGKVANVNDLTTFPPNGSWLVTYPTSGDISVDSANPDTFQKFQLIRLPNGNSKTAADFVAFSEVCVHLWCSPHYDPENSTSSTDETYQCPCHGSVYRVPDGLSIAGPASVQAFPANAIPMLTLTADSSGDLWIEVPKWDTEHNGLIGYGRDYKSYDTYILPVAQGKEKP